MSQHAMKWAVSREEREEAEKIIRQEIELAKAKAVLASRDDAAPFNQVGHVWRPYAGCCIFCHTPISYQNKAPIDCPGRTP